MSSSTPASPYVQVVHDGAALDGIVLAGRDLVVRPPIGPLAVWLTGASGIRSSTTPPPP
jgi:hypothetical protein